MKTMKTVEQFRSDYKLAAEQTINHWNEEVELYSKLDLKLPDDKTIQKYADLDKATKLATLNLMKLDQQINEAANNEIYNHIDFIIQDWQDAYFDVRFGDVDHKIETETTMKRKSKADRLKDDYLALKAYHSRKEGQMMFYLGQTPDQEIQSRNPTAYKAYHLLDEQTLIDLKFNVKKVDEEIILKENMATHTKLLKLILKEFQIGGSYSNADIKKRLQLIYDKLNIREVNGKIKVATASQLGGDGMFDLIACKVEGKNGKVENGRRIVRSNFALHMAA